MSKNIDIISIPESPSTKKDGNTSIYTYKKSNTGEIPTDPNEANKELMCAFNKLNPIYGSIRLSKDCFPEGVKKLITKEFFELLEDVNLHLLYTPGKNENEAHLLIERNDGDDILVESGNDGGIRTITFLTIIKDQPAEIIKEGKGIRFKQGPLNYYIPNQKRLSK